MWKKLLLAIAVLALLTGCYNEEETKEHVKNEVSDFFDLMILEDIDGVMPKFVSGTETYYDFYTESLATFKESSLNYTIKEMSFVTSTKEQQVVNVLVDISGIQSNDEKVEYEALYTITFVPTTKSQYKIEFINVQYNI